MSEAIGPRLRYDIPPGRETREDVAFALQLVAQGDSLSEAAEEAGIPRALLAAAYFRTDECKDGDGRAQRRGRPPDVKPGPRKRPAARRKTPEASAGR